ncbi:MAG: FkbM family methyltransferase [Gammaproteobacteria bacterium]|nr:FkbM family methyltransferase [Gammaproteobacteria bacterium]
MNLASPIAFLVKVYRRLPYKPFKALLIKLYWKYLTASKNHRMAIKKIDGIRYELDLSELIDSGMFYEGAREPNTANALTRLAKPGNVVFDIGANVGSHTLPLAKLVGPEGMVYAFEPVVWAHKKLERNMELNSFKNIRLVPVALSDQEQTHGTEQFRASFKISKQTDVGADGKLTQNWWEACDKVNVVFDTMDAFTQKNKLSRLDLIKLDVDGYEGKVIRGAKNTLERFKPIILMEIAPSWAKARGENLSEITKDLGKLGYRFFDEEDFSEIDDIECLIESILPGASINVILAAGLKPE